MKNDKFIEHNKCPEGCTIFHERRVGANGPFYYCHRCKNTISEDTRGGISTPCGTCTICGGLLFWRVASNGNKYKACWTAHKHASIFSKNMNKK